VTPQDKESAPAHRPAAFAIFSRAEHSEQAGVLRQVTADAAGGDRHRLQAQPGREPVLDLRPALAQRRGRRA
jgi:hypothetical protein